MREGEAEIALTEAFKRFPGIGQRQAQRFAKFIASADAGYIRTLTERMQNIQRASRQCPECFIRHESRTDICEICIRKDADTLIVVEKDADAYTLVNSLIQEMSGCFFILGGLIPIANSDEDRVRLQTLIETVRKKGPSEVIVAFSVHPDADHTAHIVITRLKEYFPQIKITTLGRGLSSGSELEYSDQDTLANALNRRSAV